MDAIVLIIILLGLGAVTAFLVVRSREGRSAAPLPAATLIPAAPVPPPKPEPDMSKAVLKLPSSHPHFQFICRMTVLRQPLESGPKTPTPQQAAEWAVYSFAKDISSRFSLTESSQLQARFEHELPVPRKASSIGLAVWAHCDGVEVHDDELELVRKLHVSKLDWMLEEERFEVLDKRIERLSRIMEDPRLATLWWFAQNQDKLEHLPEKAQLLFNLDRLINPRNHEVSSSSLLGEFGYVPTERAGPSDGRDLDDFINEADVSAKAAVSVVLSGIYRDHGREDLAERAARLADPPESEADTGRAGAPEDDWEERPPV